MQLVHAHRKLCDDPNTRQAVITLWDFELDNERGKHDYPCTLSLHFMIRNHKLDLHVTMRSNDVWWGLAYDAFQFTQLQATLACSLGIGIGRYFHHANSLHVYERDFDKIESLHTYTPGRRPMIFGIGLSGEPINEAVRRARCIGHEQHDEIELTLHERWYVDVLRAKTAP
jgi:thymidylate synthase